MSASASIPVPVCFANRVFVLGKPHSPLLPLYRYFHPLTRQPVTMSNHHIYAFNNWNPQWDLPTSEEGEAVERTIQALRENKSAIEEVFRKDLDVYWVIM